MQASQKSESDSKLLDTLIFMLKSLPGWLSLFLFWNFRYPFCIIAVGLLVIEVRTGWTIIRHPCSNFPTVVAIFDRVFWPERLQYVASSDLHRGHMLVETDLAVGSNVRSYLRPYLPVKSSLIGKYLLTDVGKNTPLNEKNLTANLPVRPENGTIVHVRLKQKPAADFLEPPNVVTLSSTAGSGKVEGIVIGNSSDEPASKSKSNTP
jgi:hypothetical protein